MKQITQKLIKTFNKPSTLFVISSYPDPKHGVRDLNAVAWHTQRSICSLANAENKIIVLAEKLDGKEECYLDGENILVMRIWEKGHPSTLVNLFKAISRFFMAKKVFISFEFNMFGGVLPVLLLPSFLALLKVRQYQIFFELHQVLLDISLLSKHINISNKLIQSIFNVALYGFYTLIGLLSDKVIVFESQLKKRLSPVVNSKKIDVIPLLVSPAKKLSQAACRKKLGLKKNAFVVMTFGFVNWYKGTDWLVNAMNASQNKNVQLVVAGGESPTLKHEVHYQKFYADVQKAASKNAKIVMTGYIADKDVSLYFGAADVVVFPYRVFMSASGPFSLALAHRKPILLSENLQEYFQSPDMKQSLGQTVLSQKDMTFKLTSQSLTRSLAHFQKHQADYQQFVDLLADERSIQSVQARYRVSLASPTAQKLKPVFGLPLNKSIIRS